jgi:hypothetical protein
MSQFVLNGRDFSVSSGRPACWHKPIKSNSSSAVISLVAQTQTATFPVHSARQTCYARKQLFDSEVCLRSRLSRPCSSRIPVSPSSAMSRDTSSHFGAQCLSVAGGRPDSPRARARPVGRGRSDRTPPHEICVRLAASGRPFAIQKSGD